jgi:hypothetical protein
MSGVSNELLQAYEAQRECFHVAPYRIVWVALCFR